MNEAHEPLIPRITPIIQKINLTALFIKLHHRGTKIKTGEDGR